MTVDNPHFRALNVSVPPDVLPYFWGDCLTFYEDGRPAESFIILQVAFIFEFLVGSASNLWLICHIFSKRSKVAGFRPADVFPLHLSLVHVLFFASIPLRLVNDFLWQSGSALDVLLVPMAIILVMKPLLLCLVCVESYLAVVRPITYLRLRTPKYRWGCVAALWCVYALRLISTERTAMSVCIVLFPVMAVDTFCCLAVLRALKKPPPGDHTKAEDGEKGCMKKRAFVTIAIIQAVLTLNYLPFIVSAAVEQHTPVRLLKCQYLTLAMAAATSCTYLQPLLYLHRLGRLHCSRAQNS